MLLCQLTEISLSIKITKTNTKIKKWRLEILKKQKLINMIKNIITKIKI